MRRKSSKGSVNNNGLDRNNGLDCILSVHEKLQELVDTFFNGGQRTDIGEQLYPIRSGIAPLPPGAPPPPGLLSLPIPAAPTGTLPIPPILPPAGQGLMSLVASIPSAASFAPRVHVPLTASLPSNALPLPNPAILKLSSRSRRSTGWRRNPTSRNTGGEVVNYVAPKQLKTSESALVPISTFGTKRAEEECAVCLSALTDTRSVVSLEGCGHCFCGECIRSALKVTPKCPTCRKSIGEPQGKMPSGSMSISTSTVSCSSYPPGTIVIRYFISGGIQYSYHDNPGVPFTGASRVAYLPNNDEGQKLLKRLKFAFSHGLTFTVGTSQTSGAPNVVTWASIHHKTSVSGGARTHGFPDPSYFTNVNGELDALDVPPAHEL